MIRLLLQGLLLSCSALAMAQPKQVVIAFDDAYPPYCFVENQRPAGLYVQLIRRAAQALPGWDVKLVARPWARAVQEAEQGKVDGFLPPFRGLGRDWVSLYAGPLSREEIVLSCRQASKLGPDSHWPTDFVGRRIGTMRGQLLSQALIDGVKQGRMSKREFRDSRDALAALAVGEIDCYANDRLSIELSHERALNDGVWAARMPARLEAPYVLLVQQAYVGFSRQSLSNRPELAGFVRALDAQLAQMRASGEIQRVMSSGVSLPTD